MHYIDCRLIFTINMKNVFISIFFTLNLNCVISNYYDNISSNFKFCFYSYSKSIKKFLLCLTTRISCFTCTLPLMQNTNTPFGVVLLSLLVLLVLLLVLLMILLLLVVVLMLSLLHRRLGLQQQFVLNSLSRNRNVFLFVFFNHILTLGMKLNWQITSYGNCSGVTKIKGNNFLVDRHTSRLKVILSFSLRYHLLQTFFFFQFKYF